MLDFCIFWFLIFLAVVGRASDLLSSTLRFTAIFEAYQSITVEDCVSSEFGNPQNLKVGLCISGTNKVLFSSLLDVLTRNVTVTLISRLISEITDSISKILFLVFGICCMSLQYGSQSWTIYRV